MDEIMDTSRMRRSRKMEEKIKELENEIRLLRVNTMEVVEKCSGIVGKVESIQNHEDYLKAYTSAYSRLSKFETFYSNVNGELEILLADTEKEKFDIKIPPGAKSEGFEETDPLELKKTFKDFKAITISGDTEKVEEFPSKTLVDSYQRNNEANEIDENNLDSSDFGPVLENNNNNNNHHPSSETSGNHQNLVCPPSPLIDNTFCLRSSYQQHLNFSNLLGLSSNVCPPGFSNSPFPPRLSESRENGKCNATEENPGPETTYEDNLKPFNIDRKIGSFHDIYLTNLVSPDEFYAQIRNIDVNVQTGKMMEEMKKFFGSGPVKTRNYHSNSFGSRHKKYLASIELKGGYALGYSGDRWSRLKILDWRTEIADDLVNAFHLDNGRMELMPLENLQPMDEVFMKYPLLAQKFYLPFILPNGKEWSRKDVTMFEILTEAADVKFHLKVEITENDPNRKDHALGVNLIVPESGIIVNKKLVEHGAAVLKPEKDRRSTDN